MTLEIQRKAADEWRVLADGFKMATIRHTDSGYEARDHAENLLGTKVHRIEAVDLVKERFWNA